MHVCIDDSFCYYAILDVYLKFERGAGSHIGGWMFNESIPVAMDLSVESVEKAIEHLNADMKLRNMETEVEEETANKGILSRLKNRSLGAVSRVGRGLTYWRKKDEERQNLPRAQLHQRVRTSWTHFLYEHFPQILSIGPWGRFRTRDRLRALGRFIKRQSIKEIEEEARTWLAATLRHREGLHHRTTFTLDLGFKERVEGARALSSPGIVGEDSIHPVGSSTLENASSDTDHVVVNSTDSDWGFSSTIWPGTETRMEMEEAPPSASSNNSEVSAYLEAVMSFNEPKQLDLPISDVYQTQLISMLEEEATEIAIRSAEVLQTKGQTEEFRMEMGMHYLLEGLRSTNSSMRTRVSMAVLHVIRIARVEVISPEFFNAFQFPSLMFPSILNNLLALLKVSCMRT